MFSKLITLFRVPTNDKILIIQLLLRLLYCSVIIKIRSFKKLAPKIGIEGVEVSEEDDKTHELYLRKVAYFTVRVAKYIPWPCLCLAQAIAVKGLLEKKGIPSTMYLGLNKVGSEMKAHAWLRCGSRIVTGKSGYESFSVISKFT